VDQLGDRSGVKAEARRGYVRQKAGARGVIGVEELARAAVRVALAVEKALLILRRKKCRLVVIEPPGDPGRRRVLEVDDGVLVAGKLALVKERAGAMHQAAILIAGAGGDALTMEACEQRG
jgi:hypothetical protein